jgi:2-polyprenyl-3-methyl-5-hydroxy-6-metoxy-1,4-benzoquinol methylase
MAHFASELKACPSCGTGNPLVLDYVTPRASSGNNLPIALVSGCETCGLVFVNPPPSKSEVDAYYQPGGAWEQKLEKRKRGLAKKLERLKGQPRPTSMKEFFVAEAKRLHGTKDRPQVLDFGCGDGNILDALQAAGWDTAGIDPATAHEITRHVMLEAIPSEPTYDLIIMKHVLEHLPEPLSLLRAARAALFEGGHLLVGVPNLDRLAEHGKKDYCVNRLHHLTAYTTRSLSNLLALAGFSVVRKMDRGQLYRLGLVARATTAAEPLPHPLRDVQREFRQAAIAREGWLRATFIPVRRRALRAHQQAEPGLR